MPPAVAFARAWRRLEELRPVQLFLLIFVTAVAVRMAISVTLLSFTDLTRYEMERTAIAFAHTGTLADPYNIPTGPTAHVSPGYAVLMGLIFRYFGEGWGGEIVKQLLSVSLAAVQYALLPFLAPAFGISRRAGLLAGVIGALLPVKYSTETLGDWEATAAALALLLMTYMTARTWRTRNFTAGRGALEGLGWGVTLLIASAILPVFLGLLVFGFLRLGRQTPRAFLSYAVSAAAIAAVCLAPWAWRNQRQLGSPIFTRSNGGLELQLSNNDMAGPIEPLNYKHGVYDRYHPLQNTGQAELVRSMGEVAYNREKARQGIEWIRSHPRRFAELTAERFFFTWFPGTSAHSRDTILDLVTLGAIGGIILLARTDSLGALLLFVLPLTYTPIFSLIHVNVRHRYPIDWMLLLLGAYFTVFMVTRLLLRRDQALAMSAGNSEGVTEHVA